MKKKLDLNKINIFDNDTKYYGADQQWFKKRTHAISGCGPTTAALITMYMAAVFPKNCNALYPNEFPAKKDDFIAHMSDVREYVKPSLMGLTNILFFKSSTVAFAKSKGVSIRAQQISPKLNVGIAYGFIKQAINEKYMPALLILRNPSKELAEFTWHWMAVTGYDNDKNTIFISTHGKESELAFELVWNQQKKYKTNCVYFYPE